MKEHSFHPHDGLCIECGVWDAVAKGPCLGRNRSIAQDDDRGKVGQSMDVGLGGNMEDYRMSGGMDRDPLASPEETAKFCKKCGYNMELHRTGTMEAGSVKLATPVCPDLPPIPYGQVAIIPTNQGTRVVGKSMPAEPPPPAGGANDTQVGGSHYRGAPVQHWDMVAMHGLDYFQGQITKYVMRWRKKNGLQDLYKARHFLQKYIEVEEAKATPTGERVP